MQHCESTFMRLNFKCNIVNPNSEYWVQSSYRYDPIPPMFQSLQCSNHSYDPIPPMIQSLLWSNPSYDPIPHMIQSLIWSNPSYDPIPLPTPPHPLVPILWWLFSIYELWIWIHKVLFKIQYHGLGFTMLHLRYNIMNLDSQCCI